MAAIGVALLAQVRRALDQQPSLGGTMRRMAVEAVLTHRLVFPQQRAALFRMAVVADLVDPEFLQQLRTRRTMRVVAVAAHHLALADRVM